MSKPDIKVIAKSVSVALRGISVYSHGRYLEDEDYPKLDKESTEDKDVRLWKEKGWWDKDGYMVIPAMQIKNALANAAKHLSMKIPGGTSRYTKHFKSGIMITEDWKIWGSDGKRIHKDSCIMEKAFPINKANQVIKSRYPKVNPNWTSHGIIIITDSVITIPVFNYHIVQCGLFIGIGRYRVGNGGAFGSFEVMDVTEM
jgi:hypothetical protein